MPTRPETPSPAAWPEVLARVQQALAKAVESAERREQALAQSAAPPDGPPAWWQALAQVQDRCAGLEECTRGAKAKIADADAALAEGEAGLRAWLQAAEAARAKLADWAGGAVG